MILDTNAVSALFAGDEALGDLLSAHPRHHLPVIVLGEYRFGLLRSRHRERLGRLPDETRTFEKGRFEVAHDSWVVGDEPYVSLHFQGAGEYAR